MEAKTAEEHNKTLATLYFIYGAMHGLTLIGLLLLVFVVKLTTPAAELISGVWVVGGAIAFLILFMAVGLIPLIVGFGFRHRRGWVKPLGLALAVVSLINVPIGTALGIYTLKFFRGEVGAEFYGGRASAANDEELRDSVRGTQPLMKWTNRLK